MNAAQLSIFDRLPLKSAPFAAEVPATVDGEIFALDDRVQIAQVGPPLERLNGQQGKIVGLLPGGAASVKVEGIATAIVLRVEALTLWTPIGEFTAAREEAESVGIFCLGDRVECEGAYVGRVGTVRRVGVRCEVTVAWIDYGEGVPPYPCPVERLSLAE